MDRDGFREALLHVMERKVDRAWPAFTLGEVPADGLHVHLEQEYGTYVRDFAVMLGRAYVQCPIDEVRRMVGENALACYGFDRAALEAVARRVGPESGGFAVST